jgi:hypothetical protein
MYVFCMGTKVIFWGRHFLNKNNNHAHEVHEIIFLFKKYMIIIMIQTKTTWIIVKYMNVFVWHIICGPIMHNVFKNIIILWVFQ